jgi:tripartite-type tricarboxylate transporter receptor subunit TctC
VKLQNVPYRGSAPALNDLVAGSVDCMFDNLGVSLQLVKAGKLKLLAVASPERMASLPDVPAIAQSLPGFESVTWYAVVAPPHTPAAVIDKINAGMNEALRDPKYKNASPSFRPRRSAAHRSKPQLTSNKKPSGGRTSSAPRT